MCQLTDFQVDWSKPPVEPDYDPAWAENLRTRYGIAKPMADAAEDDETQDQ